MWWRKIMVKTITRSQGQPCYLCACWESRFTPLDLWLLIFKDLQKNFCLLREPNEDNLAKQDVCKCFIWETNLRTMKGEVLSKQTIEVEAYFLNGDLPSNNTTQNQPKNSCKPVDFKKKFAFYLCIRKFITIENGLCKPICRGAFKVPTTLNVGC